MIEYPCGNLKSSTCVTLNGSGIQLAMGPQPLWLRNHNFGPAQRIMVKRLATSPHDPLGITYSACKNQLVMVSVQYGPFNPYIPIRSTTICKSRVAIDPIAMHTSWRSNSDIASVTSIGYPRMSASGESSTTMHRLLHASGSHPIPTPYDPKHWGSRISSTAGNTTYTETNPQLEEQSSQKQLDSWRYRARRTTPWLEVQSLQKQHTAGYQNRSGHRTCERMGVTRPLDHTRYQIQYKPEVTIEHVREWELPSRSITRSARRTYTPEMGHGACERMGATQPLNHTQCDANRSIIANNNKGMSSTTADC
ncbi:hypothetical protein F511_26799 [Dorcoceras hygrometricum]|uniref:Uncharacterized protein n=1 Tax=Dorcoceras hygrometricum TaxID=472368 RepID=A0A2Z7AIL6_9LAMI|nr:hypothetical protein F511_26799 [Dorcoceras hygrometricum]